MYFVPVARPVAVLHSPVEPGLLQALCRVALGIGAQIERCELLATGHHNTSYRVELARRAPVVLRLGPEPTARLWRHEQALLQRQCSVQPALATLGDVTPRLLYADATQRLLARDWAVFEWHGGEVWEHAASQIDAAAAEALWRQFGALARRLHTLRGERWGFPPPAPAHASFSSWFLALVGGLAADLAEQGVAVAGLAEFVGLLRHGRQRLDDIGEPRLVHGDLWLRNLLVERSADGWRLSGLLDAERAFYGDPSAEWIFGFLDLPAAFWDGYGRRLADADLAGDALWRRRAYQARGALQMMLEGQRFGFDAGFAHRQFAHFAGELRRLSATPALAAG